MAASCTLSGGLQARDRTKFEADLPKVSGRRRECGRLRGLLGAAADV
jgi:hypothetical protein